MKYYCDKCMAEKVTSGQIEPTSKYWGANQEPWKPNYNCDNCASVENCTAQPQFDFILRSKKRSFIEKASESYGPLLKCCKQILSHSQNGKTKLYGPNQDMLMDQYLVEVISDAEAP